MSSILNLATFAIIILTICFFTHVISVKTEKVSSTASPEKLVINQSKDYVYLTGATYCNQLAQWNCSFCKQAATLGHQFAGVVANVSTKTLALFTIRNSTKEIVVSFRGTAHTVTTLNDAAVLKVRVDEKDSASAVLNSIRDSLAPEGVLVHVGFLLAAKSIYPKMVDKLGKLLHENKGFSVVLTGSSLGAAVASLSLYMIQEKMKLPPEFLTASSYSVFGYGQPRVGNRAYVEYWRNKGMQAVRVVNRKDSVVHLPPTNMGFFHYGPELWITDEGCRTCKEEDATCSGSVPELERSLKDHQNYWDVNYLSCTNAWDFWAQYVLDL